MVVIIAGAVLMAACGSGLEEGAADEPAATTTEAPETSTTTETDPTTTVAPGPPRYQVWGMVTEDDERGTILCLGPLIGPASQVRCGEPIYEVVGLDWHSFAPDDWIEAGLFEAHLLLTGTLDGDRLTLTDQPRLRTPPPDPVIDALDDTSACAAPSDGWSVVDPGTTHQAGLEAAVNYATEQPEFGGWWLDRSSMGGADPTTSTITEDPAEMVLNVRFTGDLASHESSLRDLWGGALCVSGSPYTRAEMEEIERQLVAEIDGTGLSVVHDGHGKVLISMGVVPHGLQAEIDERFGEGVVLLTGAFRPVED